MRKNTVEFMVGVFVLIGIACVGYLTVKLGKMEFIGDDAYTVSARFQSVSGLKKGATVEMAGVPIGKVDQIKLDTNDLVAVIRLKIYNHVRLTDDVIASIKTAGLIGDKYVKVTPGGSDVYLKPGDTIIDTESPLDVEDLIAKYVFGGVD